MPPRRASVGFRSALPIVLGLGASGNSASTAAVLVPTLEPGFAGLVSAPFFQAHVLPFLRAPSAVSAPATAAAPLLGLLTCDFTHVASGLPALLRARARRGLLGVSLLRHLSTLGGVSVCISRLPFPLTAPLLAPQRILRSRERQGRPADI